MVGCVFAWQFDWGNRLPKSTGGIQRYTPTILFNGDVRVYVYLTVRTTIRTGVQIDIYNIYYKAGSSDQIV